MKKTAALILAAALLLGCLAVAQADTVVIGNTSAPVPVKDSYPDNPVVEGENPFTGLPASGEPFTPVLLVLGPPDYEPFWATGTPISSSRCRTRALEAPRKWPCSPTFTPGAPADPAAPG